MAGSFLFLFAKITGPFMEKRQITKGWTIMLAVVKIVAQIAVGVAVGNAASDALDKVVDSVKKVVKAKKGA